MKKSILIIEPVAKNYPRFDTDPAHIVTEKFYEVRNRAVVNHRGFIDASEEAWFESVDSFLSEGCILQ